MISRKQFTVLVLVLNSVSVLSRILKPSELKPKLIANTSSGLVQGSIAGNTTVKGKTIYRFRGIPYAEPPVGSLRFEPAVPKEPWNGVWDASERASFCTQGDAVVEGSEDCLYLKIYTTKLPKKKWRLPVLVWFYGGGFYEGNPDFDKHSPKHLLDEDVMVVSFSYRVGIFGFLATNDTVAPGNMALKDQLLALKWINRNIENFGGDPGRIVLMGQSAGAAAIGYLIASKQSKGLASGAIMLSGNPLNQWALSREAVNYCAAVAREFGIDTTNSKIMVESLKAIPRDNLQQMSRLIYQKMLVSNPFHGLPIGPVMEPPHEDAIYTGNYHRLLEQGDFADIPIIMGHTSLEAGPGEINAFTQMFMQVLDVMPEKMVPISLNLHSGLDNIGKEIKKKYFGNNMVSTSYYEFKQFATDDQFVRGIYEAVRYYSHSVPVYFYQFSYQGLLSGVTERSFPGAGHCEDLSYIFDTGLKGTEEDYLVRQRFVRMIANFAATGNPTPSIDPLLNNIQWTPNDQYTHYIYQMDIDAKLSVTRNPHQEISHFWRTLFENEGNPPYSTF